MSVNTKTRLVQALVFPVVTYGCETWTMRKADIRRIDAFEMWIWRRLLRIPWTKKKTNDWVLTHINTDRSLLNVIFKQQLTYYGHITRNIGSLEKDIFEGELDGRRKRGRPPMKWLDNIKKVTQRNDKELKQDAMNRLEWRKRSHCITRGRSRPDGL